MTVNQIYQLLNDVANQCYGANAVAVTDLQGLVSLRDSVIGSGTDNFLGVLVDRIGKTVIRTLNFRSTFPNFIMEDYQFSAILQKIEVDPMAAQSQEAWEVGQVGFTPTIYKIDKPSVHQGFFKNVQAWEIDVTIPDVMYKTAFDSESQMAAFLTAIYDTIATSLEMQLENDIRIAIMGFIGEKVNASNGIVDLVALYNDFATTPVTTAAQALATPDFYRFSGMIMRNYIKYLGKPSELYNMGTRIRATQREDLHVLMLTEFASAYTTYLSADTFHDELVKLPLYSEVEYWQGTGTTAPNFDDCSNVNVKIPSNGTAVDQAGVVCVMADREAIGTGLYDRFSAVDRNNRNRFSNVTEGVTIQSFIDTSENGLVFIVVDPTP